MFDKSVIPETKEEIKDFLMLLVEEMSKQKIICSSQARLAQEFGNSIRAACVEFGISEAEVYGIKKGGGVMKDFRKINYNGQDFYYFDVSPQLEIIEGEN